MKATQTFPPKVLTFNHPRLKLRACSNRNGDEAMPMPPLDSASCTRRANHNKPTSLFGGKKKHHRLKFEVSCQKEIQTTINHNEKQVVAHSASCAVHSVSFQRDQLVVISNHSIQCVFQWHFRSSGAHFFLQFQRFSQVRHHIQRAG